MPVKPEALARERDLEPLDVTPYERVADPLTTLKAVHDEAEETSELANLLGRSLYVGLLLPLLVLTAIALSDPPLTRGVSFSVLVLMGAGAFFYAYVTTMRAPFDRAALKAFSADLDAILLYTGFAWGAGAFLILPPNADPAFATFFSGCTAAIVAMIVRARAAVLMFAAPAGLLTALAALLRPLERPLVGAAMALTACVIVAGSVALWSWMKRHDSIAPSDAEPA